MSARLVHDSKIAIVAHHASRLLGVGPLRIARELRRLNNASMANRYGEAPVPFGSITPGVRGMSCDDRALHALDLAAAKPLDYRAATSIAEDLEYQCAFAPANHRSRPILRRVLEALSQGDSK